MNEIMRKTYLLVIMAALFAAFSCTKVEVIDVQGEVIAVKEMAVQGGTFMLPITVQNENKLVWKVRPLNEWLHVDDAEWKQNAYNVLVRCDSNESSSNSRNFARVGHLVVETYDGFVADTVVVKQRGLQPSVKLSDATAEATETTCLVTFNTNLTDACRPNITFSADAEWVEGFEYLGNGVALEVTIAANGGAERSANIKVVFVDAWGDAHSSECVLTQKAFVASEPEPEPEPENPTPEDPEQGGENTETPGGENQPSTETENVK